MHHGRGWGEGSWGFFLSRLASGTDTGPEPGTCFQTPTLCLHDVLAPVRWCGQAGVCATCCPLGPSPSSPGVSSWRGTPKATGSIWWPSRVGGPLVAAGLPGATLRTLPGSKGRAPPLRGQRGGTWGHGRAVGLRLMLQIPSLVTAAQVCEARRVRAWGLVGVCGLLCVQTLGAHRTRAPPSMHRLVGPVSVVGSSVNSGVGLK